MKSFVQLIDAFTAKNAAGQGIVGANEEDVTDHMIDAAMAKENVEALKETDS